MSAETKKVTQGRNVRRKVERWKGEKKGFKKSK
jgi:hypothetical protein